MFNHSINSLFNALDSYWSTAPATFSTYSVTYPYDEKYKKVMNEINSMFNTGHSFPVSNVYIDNCNTLVYELALAGYTKEDIDITFDTDQLVIKSKKSEEVHPEDKKIEYLKRDIKKSNFTVKYPCPVFQFEVNQAEAVFKDGILTIKIPKKDEYIPRKLTIN